MAQQKIDPYDMQMKALTQMANSQSNAEDRRADTNTQAQMLRHLGGFQDIASRPVITQSEIMAKQTPVAPSFGQTWNTAAQGMERQGEDQYRALLDRYKLQNQMAMTLARMKEVEDEKKSDELKRRLMQAQVTELEKPYEQTKGYLKEQDKRKIEKEKQKIELESGLRKEIETNPETRQFIEVKNMYNNIKESAKSGTAAGDMSLIFSYMKILDPGSTVREGEFANAQNSTGVPGQIRNAYNKALSGERLNETQRKDFVKEADSIYSVREKSIGGRLKFYENIAKKQDLDIGNIIYNAKNQPENVQSPIQTTSDEIPQMDEATLDSEIEKYQKMINYKKLTNGVK